MRRLETFALILACLLTLTACGNQTRTPEPSPPPQDSGGDTGSDAGGEDTTVFDCGGMQVALPNEYLDLLRVDTEFSDAEEGWKPLISVYEAASYEAAMEDIGGGCGFLFGFLEMDQAAFEQSLNAYSSDAFVFATDGERYYSYTSPTDVQFYRRDAENVIDHPDWKTWEALNEIGPLVREDFITRNGLQPFDEQDYIDHRTEGVDYACVRYYPYFAKDGDTRIYYQLLLRQPVRQGEGGIWAVDHWLDIHGNQYFYFPDTGKPAAEYYGEIQKQCDTGEHPELRTLAGAAAAFVKDYFTHETTEGSFQETRGVNQLYTEWNTRLIDIVLDVELYGDVDPRALLECVGGAAADNWGVLGRNLYGSDWFEPLMSAVADAAVGEDQQWRDTMILSFLQETRDAQTDFRTPLENILRTQAEADPDAFAAALAEFPDVHLFAELSEEAG
ncbi:hypothetical protein AALC17_03780 [Oscillospiraceae bacterium 38-13]